MNLNSTPINEVTTEPVLTQWEPTQILILLNFTDQMMIVLRWQWNHCMIITIITHYHRNILFFFFFNLPFPFFAIRLFTVPFGRLSFPYQFPCSFAFSGDATGLRGTFPGHPRPFHLTFTDIHNNIYTPMGAFFRRDSNPC
jgi:hypothetical protein